MAYPHRSFFRRNFGHGAWWRHNHDSRSHNIFGHSSNSRTGHQSSCVHSNCYCRNNYSLKKWFHTNKKLNVDNYARSAVFSGWCEHNKSHSKKHCSHHFWRVFDCHCNLAVHNLFYAYKKQKIVDKLFAICYYTCISRGETMIDKNKCISCGACVSVCPVEAIKFGADSKPVIDPNICVKCGACENTCPVEAIKID